MASDVMADLDELIPSPPVPVRLSKRLRTLPVDEKVADTAVNVLVCIRTNRDRTEGLWEEKQDREARIDQILNEVLECPGPDAFFVKMYLFNLLFNLLVNTHD